MAQQEKLHYQARQAPCSFQNPALGVREPTSTSFLWTGHTYAWAHICMCTHIHVYAQAHKEAHMNELKHMHTLIKVYKLKYSLKNL